MKILPLTVSVVEDDPSMRRGIERLLNAYGYKTLGFASAESYLERDTKYVDDCLVLDIHLGEMSGIQLLRRLREQGSDMPAIFVTAVDDAMLELEARQTGCVAYLHKPFGADLLIGAIESVREYRSGK